MVNIGQRVDLFNWPLYYVYYMRGQISGDAAVQMSSSLLRQRQRANERQYKYLPPSRRTDDDDRLSGSIASVRQSLVHRTHDIYIPQTRRVRL